MTRPAVPDAAWLWANEPCRAACPVHTDAGAYVTAIAEGRPRDAYLIARGPNPFPSICGRVCAAPCETACRRGTVDAPVAIRALKRYVTEQFGVESFHAAGVWHEAHGPVPPADGSSVGIIGGGPAGLAAAYELRLSGHPVTIYEAADRLGGMMTLGIPEYRLSRELISREIAAIVELGIEVHLGARIGETVTLDELLDRHDQLFLAVGTSRGRGLELPGAELDGVVRAVEFLLNVNQGYRVELGRRVVVVGGGNVAFDAARTALRAAAGISAAGQSEDRSGDADRGGDADAARRAMTTTLDVARAAVRQGVERVTVIALESESEIPADPEEIAEAEAEGISIVFRKGPHRFIGEDGRVTGIETIDVASVFDADGRFAPTFVEGTEAVLSAETIILAVGQSADLDFLGDHALARSRGGGVQVDPATLATSDPRIWAGGDVARGPRNLIDAVADGQRAARAIHAASRPDTAEPPTPEGPRPSLGVRVELTRRPGYRRLSTGYDAIARQAVPATATERRTGFAEVETGYDSQDAWLESLRCLRCFDNVMLEPELCILCGLCVDVCPTDCITIARADHVELGTESQSVLLLDEDLCIRCGLCVNRCPPGALSMVSAEEVADGRQRI
jgi:formate dehydrogenase beta subunit